MLNFLGKNYKAIVILSVCMAFPAWGAPGDSTATTQDASAQQLAQIQQLQQQTTTTNSAQLPAAPTAASDMQQAAPITANPVTGAQSNPGGTVSQADLSEAAFNSVTQNILPMTPAQIQRLRQLFNQTQYSAATMPGIPPRPVATSLFVDLSPGSTPPVIRLGQGFVTSILFLDSTGAPWPIEAYDIGNPSAFNIVWNKTDNTLMIQAITLYTYGNMAVRLQGLNTPVMLTLVPGQKAIDYRVDLRMPGYGPNAAPVIGLPVSANPELLGILDGIPPAGSKAVKIEGGTAQAWVLGDRLFVRTRFTVLSPAWVATMSSGDGTKAYEIPKPSMQDPVLLASQNGKIVQLKIEGL